ncbi:hypothetical protein YC2023_107753 [Brassica napus]
MVTPLGKLLLQGFCSTFDFQGAEKQPSTSYLTPHHELDGSVEETVAGIIKASSMALNLPLLVPLFIPQAQLTTMKSTSRPSTAQSQNTRKRSRPAKTRDIKISPKFFVGSSSRKRNMVKGMASPSNSRTNNQGQQASNPST